MRQRGYFLVVMFFIMVILSAMAATYSSFVVRQLRFASGVEKEAQLTLIAQSGQRYARYMLKQDSTFRRTAAPVACGEGDFTVTISVKENSYAVVSEAHLKGAKKVLERVLPK